MTDKGRSTTLALGERLRHLYVTQLGFMPPVISDADAIYLRASPLSRALESVQQTFWGLYPLSARTASFLPPTIITRAENDETIYPNDDFCKRLRQLTRAFAQRTADRQNDSDDMRYLSKLLSKWMPDRQPVKVDSHPRLSGIMDHVNSTLAHGPETRLPKEFYDARARAIIDRIGVEEWFAGYKENNEYRTLGIGALAGDIVARMVGNVEHASTDETKKPAETKEQEPPKFGLSGAHDTTLAALLASMGAFEHENWPPYTSHLAFELFRNEQYPTPSPIENPLPSKSSRLSSFFFKSEPQATSNSTPSIARTPLTDLSPAQRSRLYGYFVRIRYNDRPVTVPACRPMDKHFEGDESFCTLEAFKSVVDSFTPRDWKRECSRGLDTPVFPPPGAGEGR